IVTTSFGGGCPVIDAPFVGFRTPASAAEQARCREWSAAVHNLRDTAMSLAVARVAEAHRVRGLYP
ncbi:hypothetical protein SB658_28110, partial [Bacillus sp. SIMBA_008]|uniref:hypothetical protein n=1 Tax=Bacillus sp. SIMBA_008 TaxID=3085757 RepID=UPI00397B4ED0